MCWSVISNKFVDPGLHFHPLTPDFSLERGTRQGDPISAFVFILAFEILFHLIKSKPEIKELAIFDHCYLYSTYVDDTTLFPQDAISRKHMFDTFYFCLTLLD